MALAYVLLGSNLGDKLINLSAAISKISETELLIKTSSIYETAPWGYEDTKNFLNQVILIETSKSPEILLSRLLEIETQMGRKRTTTLYESRIIDLDILFYNDQIIQSKSLTIPHPRLHLRKFTLEPLYEIAPSLIHPVFKKTVDNLLQECPDKGDVKKIDL